MENHAIYLIFLDRIYMANLESKQKRIIVVLGMHRSGTSVIARSLKVLGVELGENLMPADPGVNEKGFWEDMDFYALNEELLRVLSGREWHTLSPISINEFQGDSLSSLKIRAIELLRKKIGDESVFGIKDPRFSILLPFWKAVFLALDIDVRYVIAIRNPISIALSLQKRDGFELEKSYYLCLYYLVSCFVETENEFRVVVSYDFVMAEPEAQIRRMAEKLQLSVIASELKEFESNFISSDLCHSKFQKKDFNLFSNEMPEDVIKIFTLLESISRDKISPNSEEVCQNFQSMWKKLLEMVPAFNFMTIKEKQARNALSIHSEHQKLIKSVDDYETKIQALENKIKSIGDKRDRELDGLKLKNEILEKANYQQEQNLSKQAELLQSLEQSMRFLDIDNKNNLKEYYLKEDVLEKINQQLNEAVAKQDANMRNLEKQLKILSVEKNKIIKELQLKIEILEKMNAQYENTIQEQKAQCQKPNYQIKQLGFENNNFLSELQFKDVELESIKSQVVEQKNKVRKMEKEKELLREERDEVISFSQELMNSNSWKLMRPFRDARQVFQSKNALFSRFWQVKRIDSFLKVRSLERFNSVWYLEENPDVAKSGMNPFDHYISYGKKEGRLPAPDLLLIKYYKRMKQLRKIIVQEREKSRSFLKLLKKTISLLDREGYRGVIGRLKKRFHDLNSSRGSDRNDYSEWIRQFDTLTDKKRNVLQKRIDDFEKKPQISIIMPVFDPKPEWLEEAIDSVRKQIYPNWELCITDDASNNPVIKEILQRYMKLEARIKVVFRQQNGHISAASNSAIKISKGEWVALLDHDDLLAEHALFWVVDAINQNPDVSLIYSDEDKINEIGKRIDPYFKCEWNRDLFYSQNMITHLGVYKAKLLKEIGGFRLGVEGAQDYDLALRYIEHIKPNQIYHIPRVLYHWRVHAESTAQSSDAKPYAMMAGQRALTEHLQRQNINARAELVGHGYRVHYSLPEVCPMVSLIIPTRNGFQLIRQCIESIIAKTTYPNYEIIIVDNGSDDPEIINYFEGLKCQEKVRVIRDDREFNYSALNNGAVKLAKGELVGLLNNDLEVITPDWLSEMVSIALQPKVGAVGAKLLYPNDTLQHGGIILGIGGWAGHSHKGFPRDHPGYVGRMSLISGFMAVTGACMIVRKCLYDELGGLNDSNLKVACNDVDFCLRLREKGYRSVWTPYAELYHHESASRGYEDTPEKQMRFEQEVQFMKQCWEKQLLNDPAYSSNLTLDYEDFSLAWPPRVKYDL